MLAKAGIHPVTLEVNRNPVVLPSKCSVRFTSIPEPSVSCACLRFAKCYYPAPGELTGCDFVLEETRQSRRAM